MMSVRGFKINLLDLCRLCLETSRHLTPVFETPFSTENDLLAQKIAACLPVQILSSDSVSQKVCDVCLGKVYDFYEFWHTTGESQKKLMQWSNESEVDEFQNKIPTWEPLIKNEPLEINELIVSNEREDTAVKTVEMAPTLLRGDSELVHPCRSDLTLQKSETSESLKLHSVPKILDNFTPQGAAEIPFDFVEGSLKCDEPGPSGLQNNDVDQGSSEESGYNSKDPKKALVKKPTWFSCEFCGEKFTKFRLEVHRRKHTGERPYKCSEPGCQWAFASNGMLTAHKKVHCNDRPYICRYCNSSFKTSVHLVNHVKIHTGEKTFNCDLCNYSCIYKATMLLHRKRHLKEYTVMCEVCGKGFYQSTDLKEHMSSHTGDKPFQCNKCSESFPNKYHLRQHKQKAHTSGTSSSNPIQCEKCPRLCPDRKSFKSHMRRVHAGKRFECDICGMLVMNKSYLIEHLRVHSGEKPYICTICGKSFSGRKGMRMHEVVHTGEKKYKCEECGKRFTQKSSLNAHKKLHNPPEISQPVK